MHKFTKTSIGLATILATFPVNPTLATTLYKTEYINTNFNEDIETIDLESISRQSSIPDNKDRYHTITRTFKANKYQINMTGEGWKLIDNTNYYALECSADRVNNILTLKLVVGLAKINGWVYCFSTDGELLAGWMNIDGNRYFFDNKKSGQAHTGWLYESINDIMYFNSDGVMQKGVVLVGSERYLFKTRGNGQNAYRTTGWYTDDNGNRYYFDSSIGGRARTGWYQDGNNGHMYFNDNGIMQKYLTEIDGKIYFFEPHGQNAHKINGWYTVNSGNRYYFDIDKNSAAHTGWYQDGNNGDMYFNEKGIMQKGILEIDGKKFLFKTRGGQNAYKTTGWYTDDYANRYYFSPSTCGAALTGGTFMINGKLYTFDENGVLIY